MIKDWSKFNESSSSDNFKDEVNKIRQNFLDYEDDDVISYQIYICGSGNSRSQHKKETEMNWSVNPNNGNFDRWLETQTEEASRYMRNDYSYRQLFNIGEFGEYPFALVANIKIKSNDGILDDIGVEKLEDTLATWKRLRDTYDKVLIDMNSQHQDYKPVSIKVYFNPIVD